MIMLEQDVPNDMSKQFKFAQTGPLVEEARGRPR